MGIWLSSQGNRKTDINTGKRPDENFARELIQLFSIGLYELNEDGSPNRDNDPQTYPDQGTDLIPTYNQEDVEELAKVFTGWDLRDNKSYGRQDNRGGDYTKLMEFDLLMHEYEADLKRRRLC